MGMIEELLQRYPELTLFLVIGVGYWIGSISIFGFKFGPVTGSLFAGIAIGQIAEVPISPDTKSVLFLLFLFGIGYSVGPQFAQGLKRNGIKPVILAVVTALAGLGTALLVAIVLELDAGFAAGMLSGALTQSPAMGTATEAIGALGQPEAVRARLVAHIAVADAVCYIFGAVGSIWFLSVMAPKLLRMDLIAEARKLEDELGIARSSPGIISAWRPIDVRAFKVTPESGLVGLTVRECEARVPRERLFAQAVRRGKDVLAPDLDLVLEHDDVVAVSGPREALVALAGPGREEVDDPALLNAPVAVYDILITRPDVIDKSLGQIARMEWARGIYPRQLMRGGVELPLFPSTEVHRGDVVRIAGPQGLVEQAADAIGTLVRPSEETDLVVLGLAIFLGGILGALLAVPVGAMQISLGTSVGTLLAGLLVGHLRARNPLFGRIPDGAVSLMTSLGLAAFVALTGLHAGPIFLEAVAEAGLGLIAGGAFVTLMPLLVGLYFGRYVLKMHPVLLLGSLAGAQTSTAALAAVQDRAGSMVAVLGYTPTYPLGHIILTTWGTVIVGLIGA
ncbi:TrkA C-terminal domain-containing protein [Erythrobacter sp. T5W1-R]|uniref:aspartate:alanine exchanger family transporter n=1 Tax=Erythrobacter sp. T5W1-R TaxID=3101752 RepID=UPI002AFFDCE4|nr:TrkA C-terminal domain-containing protein [Erythrobacter sp. T5W1-R]MEA1619945.1 TrkA C-terminal domain-containing protein [Erythrobacter sp. T5W1-R]